MPLCTTVAWEAEDKCHAFTIVSHQEYAMAIARAIPGASCATDFSGIIAAGMRSEAGILNVLSLKLFRRNIFRPPLILTRMEMLATRAVHRVATSAEGETAFSAGSSRCSEKARERALGVASFAAGYPVVNDGAITLRGGRIVNDPREKTGSDY
jgi:hypothetical protein